MIAHLVESSTRSVDWIADVHPDDMIRERIGTRDGLPRYVANVTLWERERSSAVIGPRFGRFRVVGRHRKTFRGETARGDAERWAGDVATLFAYRGERPARRGGAK